MSALAGLAALLFLGCVDDEKADWRSVDDACPSLDTVGYEGASDAAIEAFERASCYRALLDLDPSGLDERLDAASQAHTDYMAAAGTLSHDEPDTSNPHYTGQWVWDRVDAAGYTNWTSVAEVVAQGYAPADAVDSWINSVYHRVPFASPEWSAVGFGETSGFTGMTFVLPFPESGDRAVIYPADGQTEVPTTFLSDQEYPDPAPDANGVGPPITVSVGSSNATNDPQNPYGLELLDARLEGPDGEVDLITLVPDDDPYLLNTVALVPEDTLDEGEEYTAEVTVSWSGGEETLSATFRTED